jgi:hypothetical protein
MHLVQHSQDEVRWEKKALHCYRMPVLLEAPDGRRHTWINIRCMDV